jgi:ABC-type sulfate transport system permease component
LNYKNLGILGGIAIAISAVVALPVVSVLASFFGGFGETWLHIAETALPRYVLNTAVLLALVSFGVVSMGVVSAWLVTAYRFPGRDLLEWALLLPLAMPAYVMAYAYTDWLQFTGAVQTALREITRWQVREYWFPEVRSLPGAAVILSFALYPYVYLVARTAFHDLSRSAIEAGRLAGYGALGAFFRVAVPLARPASIGSRPGSSRLGSRWATAPPPRSSRAACLASWSCCSRSSARTAAAPPTIVSGPGARVRIRCAAAGRCSPSRHAPRLRFSASPCRRGSSARSRSRRRCRARALPR